MRRKYRCELIMMGKNEITVALAGNPNVGKSTVFNALTGLKQHTGNWTGKTVDLAQGKREHNGVIYNFVDIPGTYSLKPHSEEEAVAGEYICFGDAQRVAVVCDATSLERNLYLALQIIETGADTVICVNLLDEAKKKGISVNTNLLEKELGVRVVGMTARDGVGVNELLDTLCQKEKRNPIKIQYNENIEAAIEYIIPVLRKNRIEKTNHRWLALRLLENDASANNFIHNDDGFSQGQKNEILKAVALGQTFLKEKGELIDLSENIASTLYEKASKINEAVTMKTKKNDKITKGEKIFTKRFSAYFVMFLMLSAIFYITIAGANYPSQWLGDFFNKCEIYLLQLAEYINMPEVMKGMLISGGFRVLGWVVSVMLPPMAIFFPCFTLLEDWGVLPRISYVLDNNFRKAQTCGKQALTICMGYGCNCVGISGARIIDSKRERLIAILTNTLTVCNGRFPAIITLISVFLVSGSGFVRGVYSAIILALIIILSLALTLFLSNFLSRTLLKGEQSHYILELPPYRKPQISKVIINSVLNRTLIVLFRAVAVAFPAGVVIWLFANININGVSILGFVNNIFEPLGNIMGMDGKTLSAFFLGIPANEIVLPIVLMSYMGAGEMSNIESTSVIGEILVNNGWRNITAVCYIIFSVVHFPCATALLTVFKETKSIKWTVLAFLIPTVLGVFLCSLVNLIGKI